MNNKRLLSFLISILLLLGLFTFIDWSQLEGIFYKADLQLTSAAIALTLLLPLFASKRWQAVLVAAKIRIGFERSLEAIMMAFSASFFTPAKAGDLVKSVALADIAPKHRTLSCVIGERIGDLLVLGVLSFLSGVLSSKYLFAMLGLLLILFIILVSYVIANMALPAFFGRLKPVLQVLREGIRLWQAQPSQMLVACLWSLIIWLTIGVQIWLFYLALGNTIDLQTVLVVFPMVILVSLIPITPAGLGLRESAFVFFFFPTPNRTIALQ